MQLLNFEVETTQDSEMGTLFRVDHIIRCLKPDSNTVNTSYCRAVRRDYSAEFTTIKGKVYVTQYGVEKLIKSWNTPEAHKLQEQLNDIAKRALDTGFMAQGNFFALTPKSEILSYDSGLGIVVSSRMIAEKFGKSHFNVLQDLDNAIEELQLRQLSTQLSSENHTETAVQNYQFNHSNYNFQETTYTNSQNKEQRELLIDFGLFNYVVLGYKGNSAKQWKLIFIDEFIRLRLEEQKHNFVHTISQAQSKISSKLYVLYDASVPGIYKIGITTRDINTRLKELNAGINSKIRLLWLSPEIYNARDLEKDFHTYFEDKRVKSEDNPSLREWFRLEDSDLAIMESVLKFKYAFDEFDIMALYEAV